jgi:hypothetical protein
MRNWGVRALLGGLGLLVCGICCSCGGGAAAPAGPANPWTGTRTTLYYLRGDEPYDYRGPDAADGLIQAQIKQALHGRTYELDLYEVENSSGSLQSLKLHDASTLSYLTAKVPAYQIPGVLTEANGIARLELSLAGPALAWQSLALETAFDATRLEAAVARIRPYRNVNPVSGEPFIATWQIVGLNGSREVALECKQMCWLYAESKLVP